ncbi:TolC family outer membrane protein [Reinekea sp.]|uniref:TolC family outer membrane protein n=1 Tax=Reinekea sp. TaxID=1970455 RepID=UPI002A7FA5E3|nr:TolC family outer membrane protein [Reinekea sp.]
MLIKPLIAGLILAAVTAQASASQSLLETYVQALANDPQLAIARLTADNAQQDVTTGYANVLPDVTANASYVIASDRETESLFPNFDAQTLGGSISVSQNIFVRAAFTAYEAVKVNATISEIEAAYAEQELMVRVSEGYITALRAKNALAVLQAQLEAVDRQYDQTKQRYDVGLVTITDVLDASATLDQTKVSLIRAESQYDIALQNISVITGSIPESVQSISESMPINSPSEEGQQQWVEYAITQHPEIIAAQRGLEVGRLSLQAERENLLPSVSGTATFGYSDTFGSSAFDNDTETNWSASYGISVAVPLYAGGANQVAIVKRGLANNIAEQQVELLKRGKAVAVANLYRTVQADAQNVDAQIQALKSRDSALQATSVGYEVGTRNIVEVLNSQLAVFTAQNALNNARYDYLLDLLKLKKEAGQLTLKDLEGIEQYLIAD